MHRFLLSCLLAAPLANFVAAPVAADDWSHWRGHLGSGASPAASPPTEFGPDQNVRWSVEIPGQGISSPVVRDGVIYLTTTTPAGNGKLNFEVLAIDHATGQTRWRQVVRTAAPHEGTHSTNTYASASPCVDAHAVYASFGSAGIYALTHDGQEIWQRDLGDMIKRNGFGEGSSPTLAGDLLVVPWDHQGPSKLFALDRRSGAIVWQTDRDEPSNWGTPLVVGHGDQTRIITTGENFVRGYDLWGNELFRAAGQTMRPAASPVVKDDLVIVTSGFRGSFLGAYRWSGRGDLTGTADEVWTLGRDTPDIASPLVSGDRLYFYKGKTGLLSCVDVRTGQFHYRTARLPGLRSIYASPVAAGGHVYLSDRDGTIVVIDDADELRIVSTNQLPTGIDATPAPVDDTLVVRTLHRLYCFQQ